MPSQRVAMPWARSRARARSAQRAFSSRFTDITGQGNLRRMAVPALGVVHVNVNCSELSRSLPFYERLIGLRPLVHTNPPPQDGAGFGLAGEVQWDAHLLYDARGPLG